MKKIMIIAGVILLVLILMIMNNNFKSYSIYGNEKITRLGYCPTMFPEATKLAKEKNYELVEFASASDVLVALNNNYINKALIGRKAKSFEIKQGVTEKILESENTLIAIQKGFIDYSILSLIEVHTSLPEKVVAKLMPEDQEVIYYQTKQEAINKIYDGKIVLISWDEFQDDFELAVVMNGNKKVREFRGVFLYEF